jgi:hypothetical protein
MMDRERCLIIYNRLTPGFLLSAFSGQARFIPPGFQGILRQQVQKSKQMILWGINGSTNSDKGYTFT